MSRKEAEYLIGFVDVMYGVVLAIGFTYFERISTALGYLLFIFTYAVTVSDWIMVHETDVKRPYIKNPRRFVLDLVIVFFIFELITISAGVKTNTYWLWFAGLFALYGLWDILLLLEDRARRRTIKVWAAVDAVGIVVFGGFGVAIFNGLIPNRARFAVIPMLAYFAIVYLWYRPMVGGAAKSNAKSPSAAQVEGLNAAPVDNREGAKR